MPKFAAVARRPLSALLAAALLLPAWSSPALAGAVGTEQALDAAANLPPHLDQLLARPDVMAGLVARGVDPAQARSRVAAMTDPEIAALRERIDSLPAGGDLVGVLFVGFVVLLITDVLGYTKVFPFTRSIR